VCNKMKKYLHTKKGFTLVELMVSLSIFIVIMTVVMGAILSVLNLNTISQSRKTAMDNLNFSLETMTRSIRFGTTYDCASVPPLSSPHDCSTGGNSLTFVASDGTQVKYALSNGIITESVNNGTALPLTSGEVTVQNLTFWVLGSAAFVQGTGSCSSPNNCQQPRVIIDVSGIAGGANKPATQASFQIQTTVSQRKLDI
jgi:Tfp pilus assembly protein PilW